MKILTNIPEHLRGWAYLILFIVALLVAVYLIVIDVIRGGDPAAWVPYVLGVIGLSGPGLAVANTTTKHREGP